MKTLNWEQKTTITNKKCPIFVATFKCCQKNFLCISDVTIYQHKIRSFVFPSRRAFTSPTMNSTWSPSTPTTFVDVCHSVWSQQMHTTRQPVWSPPAGRASVAELATPAPATNLGCAFVASCYSWYELSYMRFFISFGLQNDNHKRTYVLIYLWILSVLEMDVAANAQSVYFKNKCLSHGQFHVTTPYMCFEFEKKCYTSHKSLQPLNLKIFY